MCHPQIDILVRRKILLVCSLKSWISFLFEKDAINNQIINKSLFPSISSKCLCNNATSSNYHHSKRRAKTSLMITSLNVTLQHWYTHRQLYKFHETTIKEDRQQFITGRFQFKVNDNFKVYTIYLTFETNERWNRHGGRSCSGFGFLADQLMKNRNTKISRLGSIRTSLIKVSSCYCWLVLMVVKMKLVKPSEARKSAVQF